MGLTTKKSETAAECEAADRRVPVEVAYRQGWNDRLRLSVAREHGHGRWFRSMGGAILSNSGSGYGDAMWSPEARAEYVRGWDEAGARVDAFLESLVIK